MLYSGLALRLLLALVAAAAAAAGDGKRWVREGASDLVSVYSKTDLLLLLRLTLFLVN